MDERPQHGGRLKNPLVILQAAAEPGERAKFIDIRLADARPTRSTMRRSRTSFAAPGSKRTSS
jgi:hypothetical protein